MIHLVLLLRGGRFLAEGGVGRVARFALHQRPEEEIDLVPYALAPVMISGRWRGSESEEVTHTH